MAFVPAPPAIMQAWARDVRGARLRLIDLRAELAMARHGEATDQVMRMALNDVSSDLEHLERRILQYADQTGFTQAR